MRKLKLDPDTLRVESFAADGSAPGARGTVGAHAATRNCPPATAMTFCETNCDCTLGCPSLVAPCTTELCVTTTL